MANRLERLDYAFDLLGATVLTSAASSIRFDFPTSYELLFLDGFLNCTASNQPRIRLNNDSAGNYDHQVVTSNSTTVDAVYSTGDSGFKFTDDSIAASGLAVIHATFCKPLTTKGAHMVGSMSFFGDYATDALSTAMVGGLWRNTSDSMSRMDLIVSSGNLAAGSAAQLYGVR